ncbi:MAG: MBL fold metallo-hydrolase [Phycisphaeraceae bacterium]|nr:MBL fold metallo-hydrolase [Phycisphaeraceae bacterium]
MHTDGTEQSPWMSVLASGSSGNCSVLSWNEGARRAAALIDLGLSPRRTRNSLASLGLSLDDISFVLLTHLDSDHFHSGWLRKGRVPGPLWMHRRHVGRASREGIATHHTEVFDESFREHGLAASVQMASHDELGVATFRIGFTQHSGQLGFATDVGRVTPGLIDHLRRVDVLAIESNYCPRLELASDRPEFLKRRIMGGSGHISNEESASAARAIGPREHLVLLHLSRQCNSPSIALGHHAGIGCPITVSTHAEPTMPIRILGTGTAPLSPPRVETRVGKQWQLFPAGQHA